MTLHTKAATEEIYQMFNQPLKQDLSDESSEESSSNDEENDEMTDSQVSAGMNRLSESTNELSINEAKPENSLKTPVREFNGISRAFPMTPIAEATETGTQFSKKVNESSPYINPMDKEIRNRILVKVTGSLINYYNHAGQDMSKEQAIKRALNGVKAKPGDKNFPMIEFPNGEIFCVRRVLGEGGFGSVFLAESGSGELSALKSENKFHSPWEYYILRKLNEKLESCRTSSSIIQARSLHCYDCESYMTLDYLSQGTLLDMVNLIFSSNEGNGLEECLMMFFTIEILRAVESMHEVGIIHGDLKPDNVMLRLSDIPDKDWSKQYTRTGENGWNAKGIVLIDFGRAIDMSMLEHNVQFVADWKMDDQDCIEMKEGRPWTYQADYHGIASIVHVLLFGKFIKVVEDEQHSTRIFRISSPFKRYWQRELWEELFYVLLNSETASPTNSLPITPLLAKCREKLETKLEEMCESSTNSLKSSLRGIEHDILQLRKKT
jgi:checkpoint serine/threonine-protein kinase